MYGKRKKIKKKKTKMRASENIEGRVWQYKKNKDGKYGKENMFFKKR